MQRSNFVGRLGWLVVTVVCICATGSVSREASAQTPTPEQIEMFRNLPPDQQQQILERMNRGGSTNSARADRERDLDFPRFITPRRDKGDDEEDGRDDDMKSMRPPRLKPEDSVLLSLEIRQYERRAPELEDSERREQAAAAPTQPAIPGRQGVTQPLSDKLPPAGSREMPPLLDRSEEQRQRLEDFRERVLRRNPYRLDRSGILNIPELGPIPLAGLTAEQATERLGAEIRLQEYIVRVTHLPLRSFGAEALKPFGYDLFKGMPSTFAPATDVPVPAEYVVGPGDEIEVQLIGTQKGRHRLVVTRDGKINFPELGPIAVGGRRFDDVRSDIEQRVHEQMIGTQASVGIGELRSIRVFVLGDAETPGSYTVSGLSTITNALFVSGGVKKIGSLRNIQLKRAGQLVGNLDLYDMLLNGDTSADQRLLPGDVIFVPPVGPQVGLSGEVRRPAIYELRDETTPAALLQMAGGMMPNADPALATIERIDRQKGRTTIDVNLLQAGGRSTHLQSGDTLKIPGLRPVLENSVVINGHVHRPGQYEYRPGMRLSDVLPSLDELRPNADQNYVLIRREDPRNRRISVFSASLSKALEMPQSAANFELAPRDQIQVFDLETGRDRIIEPLMRELRMQSQSGDPTAEVSVAGKIKVPGKYPLEPGMRVSDLLRAGGSLDEAAYGGKAELTRYEVVNGESRQAELLEIDLADVLNGKPSADVALRPFDYLIIKEIPLWMAQEEVEIRGEVKFPGRYPIHRGETLRSVMQRAGGLTDLAFADGAIFTREELKEREKKQLESLAKRMQSDLGQLSLMSAQEAGKDAGQALAVGESLLAGLREAKPVGRLVIDLERSSKAKPGSELDIVLKDGDRLLVPRVAQEVTVIGEVQSTTSHLYRADLTRDDYIAMSGGLTPRGDKNHIYVVRADGSVVARTGSAWFNSGTADVSNGDTIVVPLDTERMRPLPFWSAVTTIVYNLAISAAAVSAF